MKENYTHISIVLDRSGSMRSCQDATIEGLNSYISQQQRVKGEGTITLVQFDDLYEVNYELLPLSKAPMLNFETYQPRGGTALIDAIGRTIDSTGGRLAAMQENERPSRVIFVIQTDGAENYSSEYISTGKDRYARVREMIKLQQEQYKWDFVFLGAGLEAFEQALTLNINSKSSINYKGVNAASAFASVGRYTSAFREAETMDGAQQTSFSSEDRQNAVSPKPPEKKQIIS